MIFGLREPQLYTCNKKLKAYDISKDILNSFGFIDTNAEFMGGGFRRNGAQSNFETTYIISLFFLLSWPPKNKPVLVIRLVEPLQYSIGESWNSYMTLTWSILNAR